MSATVDVNVLVHATNVRDPLFPAASALLTGLVTGDGVLHLFWPVLLGWVRITTHPGILEFPLSLEQALRSVDALVEQPSVRVHGEPDRAWAVIKAAHREIDATGNDVPDAHLVGLMRAHGVRTIYTQDRGFRRFDRLDVRRLTSD